MPEVAQAQNVQQSSNTSNPNEFTFKDIVETKERGGRELPLLKPYDPVSFWEDIAEHFYKSFKDIRQFQANVPWLLDRLKVLKPDSLFDAGCGFARIEPFLIKGEVATHITAMDCSATALKCAKEYLSPVEVTSDDAELKKHEGKDFTKQVDLIQGDIRKCDVVSGSFDCVLSIEVLQHFNSDDCFNALRELVRISKRYIIIQERWAFPTEHSEPHIWSHDIGFMTKQLGVTILQNSGITGNMQGLVLMKR